jgi:uncharacterized repeat protein (TIGR01451 family)
MFSRRTLNVLLPVILFVYFAETTHAKSVYVISGTDYLQQMQAYKIDGTNLIHQTDYTFDTWGPVGIAIDESDYGQFLFVTFESSDKIELVNAKTMQYVGTVTVQGASNLAGIVVDKGKRKIYVMDRYTNHLYSYFWDPLTKILTPDFNAPYYTELQDISDEPYEGAYGIALDEENGLLYVGDNTNHIKYYNTTNWSKQGEIPVSCNVIGVAIDVPNQFLYYGSMGDYGQGDLHLYQYNISSSSEQSVTVGSSVAGIAVDQETGMVYITTFEDGNYGTQDRLMVYNANLQRLWYSGDIGNPAGVCVPTGDVSYKPPVFYLAKVDVNEPNSVLPGGYITYEITYGPNGVDHNNVVITDYLPGEVDFISASGPNMVCGTRAVTWQIGSLSASDPNYFVTLTVKVNEGAAPNKTITNYCEIESDTSYRTATAVTNVGYWEPNSEIIYVDSLSPCAPGTGMSWRFAYRDLQDALERARDGNEIWVAAGTYKPTAEPNYWASFQLVGGVPIYGGFPTGGGQRNWMTNETTLAGQGSYNVLTANNIEDATLDGFTTRGDYGRNFGEICLILQVNLV